MPTIAVANPFWGALNCNYHCETVPLNEVRVTMTNDNDREGRSRPQTQAASEAAEVLRQLGGVGRAHGLHCLPAEVDPEIVYEARARKVIRALKAARQDKGLTAAAVAEWSGVDNSVISRFENDTTDPRLSTLLRYASAVGVDLTIHINGANVSDYIQSTMAAQRITADMLKDVPASSFAIPSPRSGDVESNG